MRQSYDFFIILCVPCRGIYVNSSHAVGLLELMHNLSKKRSGSSSQIAFIVLKFLLKKRIGKLEYIDLLFFSTNLKNLSLIS